jgi:hypothetical protein
MNCDKLAGTEELLDRRRHRLGIDQVVRHQVVRLGLIQTLLDGALDTHQTGAELVLSQFADRAHAAVAEVVNIIDLATSIAQFDQNAITSTISSFDSVPAPRSPRGRPDG